MWREHFPTTAHALHILNAVDDDVPSSRDAIYAEPFRKGVYRDLVQTNINLRELAHSDQLIDTDTGRLSAEFMRIADETVAKLSSFDLEGVRRGLVDHRLLKHQQPEADWHDLQDDHEHLLLLAEPDSVTLATADHRHIDELVAMEIALQSAWNKFEHLSWNLNEILEDTSRKDIDEDKALRELSELALTVAGWRTRLAGWRRIALQHLRDTSKLDENIDDFFKASEEYVRHAAVARDKRFQRVVTVAGIALAAVVLGEITISIAGAGGAQAGAPRSVEASVSVLVAIGAGLVSLLLVASTFADWSRQWQTWGARGGAFFFGVMVSAFFVSTVPRFDTIKLWLFGDFWWPWPGLPLLGLTAGFVTGSAWSWLKARRKARSA